MYKYTLVIMKDEIGNRLMSIAATAAPQIDATDLENLNFARDMKTPEYQRVFNKLNDIRDSNQKIEYVYIMKPAINKMYIFRADADSNYYLPKTNDPNPIDVVAPGTYYDTFFFGSKYYQNVMKMPVYENEFVTDQWGTYLSAAAPIYDKNNTPVAFLGLDMNVSDVYQLHKNRFRPFLWFISCFLAIFLVFLFKRLLLQQW